MSEKEKWVQPDSHRIYAGMKGASGVIQVNFNNGRQWALQINPGRSAESIVKDIRQFANCVERDCRQYQVQKGQINGLNFVRTKPVEGK